MPPAAAGDSRAPQIDFPTGTARFIIRPDKLRTMALTSRNPNAISSGPAIAGASVEIWTIRLDVSEQFVNAAKKFLSPDERARADTFRNEQALRNYIIAHAALRQILAPQLQLAPGEIAFQTGPYGKPALTGTGAGHLEFNLTHSGQLALVVVAHSAEVGIDVEIVRPMPDALRLAERFFSTGEIAALNQMAPAEQAGAFLNLWTRKEALAKATGVGIANSLARFEIAPGAEAKVKAIDGDARLAAPWTLHSFTPAPGYIAAVAVRSPGAQFSMREFDGGGTNQTPS